MTYNVGGKNFCMELNKKTKNRTDCTKRQPVRFAVKEKTIEIYKLFYYNDLYDWGGGGVILN